MVGYGGHDNETSDHIKTDFLVIVMNLLYFVFAACRLPCLGTIVAVHLNVLTFLNAIVHMKAMQRAWFYVLFEF